MPKPSLLLKSQAQEWKVGALGLVAPPPIEIESPHFTGSLATLFEVARLQKIDLRNIALMPICEAYLLYVGSEASYSVDEAASAMTALCFLIERKAWLLLPTQEPEPEDVAAFEFDPILLSEYDFAIEKLERWSEERNLRFFRDGEPRGEAHLDLGDVSVSDLSAVFEALIARAEPDPILPLSVERRSLGDQIASVENRLTLGWLPLWSLVGNRLTRSEAVWTFLALLEMIRQNRVRLRLEAGEPQFSRP